MRTRNYFKYLLAAIVAIGTSVNVMAQAESVLYGLGTQDDEPVPVFNVLSGISPQGVSLDALNFKKGQFYSDLSKKESGWYVNVGEEGTISFENFKYEINSVGVRRNISGNPDERAYDTELNVSVIPVSGTTPNVVFDNKVDWSEPKCTNVPLRYNNRQINLKGISQLTVSVPASHFEGIIWVTNRNTYVREVQITYTRPEISVNVVNGDDGYQIQGYISNHAGAIVPTQNQNDFHFEYSASNDVVSVDRYTGKITPNRGGNVQLSAVLKFGDTKVSNNECHYDCYVSKVNLNPQFNQEEIGTPGTTFVYAIEGLSMPTIEVPIRPGYTFRGYWDQNYYSQENQWNPASDNGTQYYDSEPTSTSKWNRKDETTTLYAHWTAKIYQVTFNANGGTFSQNIGCNIVRDNYALNIEESKMTAYVQTGQLFCNKFWSSGSPLISKTNDEFLGWFDAAGNMVYSTSNGYDFLAKEGAYWNANGDQAQWKGTSNLVLYARWKSDPQGTTDPENPGQGTTDSGQFNSFTIIFHTNDSRNQTVSQKIENSNTNIQNVSFQNYKQGYQFKGWSYTSTGSSIDKITGDNVSPADSHIDDDKRELHLYAIWEANTYTVTLDPQGGEGGTTQVTATYGQILQSGMVKPHKTGYVFMGYRTQTGNVNNGELELAGTEYYNKDMEGSNQWTFTENKTLYAQWQPAICYIKLYSNGGKFPDNSMSANNNVKPGLVQSVDNNAGIMTLKVYYGYNFGHQLIQANPKKPGYEYLGWYVKGETQTSENQIYTVDKANWNANATTNHGYWKQVGGNLVWNYTKDVELETKYEAKFIIDDDVITFKEGSQLEADEFWVNGVINDIVGAIEECPKKVTVIDLTKSKNYNDPGTGGYQIGEMMAGIHKSANASPNILVYFNSTSYNPGDSYNAIGGQEGDGICKNLVVTDKVPMKIPSKFTAKNASYVREIGQASTTHWGTLCLPYPINIEDYENEISFYELRNTYKNDKNQDYMQFYKIKEDPDGQEIPANTPVLYRRIGNESTNETTNVVVTATNVDVPANTGDLLKEKIANYRVSELVPLAEGAVKKSWRFVGALDTKEYCGADYSGEGATDATRIDHSEMDIYYFKSDAFKKLNNNVRIIVYPYRAFFAVDYDSNSDHIGESKVSLYSILAVDADGTTTDITNLIDNSEAKGDGKIYDLSGRRVKQPVKGSIYIVDGKKKMY